MATKAGNKSGMNVQGVTALLETLKVGEGDASSLVQAVTAEPKSIGSVIKGAYFFCFIWPICSIRSPDTDKESFII